MKKVGQIFFVLIITLLVIALEFKKDIKIMPNYLYRVYLDEQVLGTIKDKNELEEYIDNEGSYIKEQYKVDKVYAPNGLQIKRIITYDKNVDSVKSVYDKLTKLKHFTIQGYQFTIRRDDSEGVKQEYVVYTTNKEIFEKAVKNTLKAYVGIEEYNNYINNTQEAIKTTGLYIDDVYLADAITVRTAKIPVTEEIYTDEKELSKFILYGTTEEQGKYTVKSGDTLESIANDNQMNVEALFVSNENINSVDNLLYVGQTISIARPNPLVQVMAEYTSVEDKSSRYSIEEKIDSTMNIGDEYVAQKGVNGIDRVTSSILKINGQLLEATTLKTDVVEPAINEIVMIGSRRVSSIGSLQWWKWPANGYVTSPWNWRNLGDGWSFHQGIDIAGGGCGSYIYASNYGTVKEVYSSYPYNQTALASSGYGNYIMINHNNGYYTFYAHLNGVARGLRPGSIVERGQVIGYMGQTGYSFGCHLHYELWNAVPWSLGRSGNGIPGGNLNPLSVSYR